MIAMAEDSVAVRDASVHPVGVELQAVITDEGHVTAVLQQPAGVLAVHDPGGGAEAALGVRVQGKGVEIVSHKDQGTQCQQDQKEDDHQGRPEAANRCFIHRGSLLWPGERPGPSQILLGLHRELPLPQPIAYQTVDHAVKHGKDRDTQHHASESKQPAEQQDREQHPEAGQSRGVPQDLGAQNIPVKLLEHKDKDHEINTLDRTDDEDQQGAWNGTDKGAKKGDDIGHTDDDRQKGGVWEVKEIAAHQRDDPNDEGVQQLAVDKAAHDAIGIAHLLHDQVCPAGLTHTVHDLFGLGREDILSGQQIDGDDNGDQQVLGQHQQGDEHSGHTGEHGGEPGNDLLLEPGQRAVDGLQIGEQIGLEPLLHRHSYRVVVRHDRCLNVRVIGQKFHQPLLEGHKIAGDGLDQPYHALIDLGQDHGQQDIND